VGKRDGAPASTRKGSWRRKGLSGGRGGACAYACMQRRVPAPSKFIADTLVRTGPAAVAASRGGRNAGCITYKNPGDLPAQPHLAPVEQWWPHLYATKPWAALRNLARTSAERPSATCWAGELQSSSQGDVAHRAADSTVENTRRISAANSGSVVASAVQTAIALKSTCLAARSCAHKASLSCE
jgi:hypothetical protein